jgi:hypothetical protein
VTHISRKWGNCRSARPSWDAGRPRRRRLLAESGIRKTRNGQSFGKYAHTVLTDEVNYRVLRARQKQKDYVMRKLTPTLTQSGLLAVLLQRQRYKIRQLAWRRAQRNQMRAALWSTLTWPWRALTARVPVRRSRHALRRIPLAPHLNLLPRPIAMSHPIHTYTELQQQIHDDLRIQHPEWIESSGESPTCDSYEARLTEMLDTLTRRGSNESIRSSSSRTGTRGNWKLKTDGICFEA